MGVSSPIRIWDLPTRCFHWLLVLCLIGSLVTIKLGGLWVDWHARFGYAALVLIGFRLVWGVVGPEHARFNRFVRGPRAVLDYVRHCRPAAGHNPLAALSVLALLAAIGFQAVSGLFVNDAIAFDGPLVRFVERELSDQITAWHKFNEWVILSLVGLHLLAIAAYSWKGHRLVGPMIHGDKAANDVPPGTLASQDNLAIRLKALLIAAVIALSVWWLVSLPPPVY
jgi:cytochrome b